MTTALAERTTSADIMERVLIEGDLAKLKPEERATYYLKVCESLGLNHLTQPFGYIVLNGKLTLYALKGCTDQLRNIHGISITKLEQNSVQDVYVVTAYGKDKAGRIDSSQGAVYVKGLVGDNLANALMKAETKAKRRLTLSMCGLGMLDESEAGSIPESVAQTIVVDRVTGEVVEERAAPVTKSKRTVPRGEAFDRYMKLYARAEELGIPLDDNYNILDSDGVDEIIAKGVKLKAVVDELKAEEF